VISREQIGSVQSDGGVVIGDDGQDLGRIGQVFLDDLSRQPAWMTVTSDAWDGAEQVVPLALAELDDGRVSVPYSAAVVRDAPRVNTSRSRLGSQHETDLLRHYGLGSTGAPVRPATTTATTTAGAHLQARHEWSLPSTGSSIRTLRLRLRPLLDVTGLPGEELDDLALAACEAAANAIEHAQTPTAAAFDVCLDIDGVRVQITIRDHGRWREPTPGMTDRGRGLLMMRNLSSLVVTVEPDGTTVTLRNASATPGLWSLRRRR
jgi:anti-sigma regulatory factor (Ser/Thr protein kinase)